MRLCILRYVGSPSGLERQAAPLYDQSRPTFHSCEACRRQREKGGSPYPDSYCLEGSFYGGCQAARLSAPRVLVVGRLTNVERRDIRMLTHKEPIDDI